VLDVHARIRDRVLIDLHAAPAAAWLDAHLEQGVLLHARD
jgi:hypothetical protein